MWPFKKQPKYQTVEKYIDVKLKARSIIIKFVNDRDDFYSTIYGGMERNYSYTQYGTTKPILDGENGTYTLEHDDMEYIFPKHNIQEIVLGPIFESDTTRKVMLYVKEEII